MSDEIKKMDLRSMDVVVDKIEQIKALFPEVVTEGKVDFEKLKLALGEAIETGRERYGLNWAGKSDCFKIIQQPSVGTLKPVREESVNFDKTENIFIEGDNLEVLKLLQKSYYGKVKMIYIDPPYNTGNDFIYPDNYAESLDTYLKYTGQVDSEGRKYSTNTEADGRFHTKWINMMYPRLYLAKNLLRDDGAMVIHTDEHEYSKLQLLLNEIFGEENELGTIIWDKKNPKGDATGIAYQHESLLVYAKNRGTFTINNELKRPKKNADKIIKKARELVTTIGDNAVPNGLRNRIEKYNLASDDLDKYKIHITLESINKEFADWIKSQDFSGGEAAYNKIDEKGNVYRLVSMAWPNKKKAPDNYFIPLIHPKTGMPCPVPDRGWRNPPETMKELLKREEIIFGEDHTVQPQRKYLLKDNMYENIPSVIPFGGSDDDVLKALGVPFENPKPKDFCKLLIAAFSDNDDSILDFFSGSSTIAHSILEMTTETGDNRKFICVQLPEPTEETSEAYKAGYKTIADIGKERIRRVIKQIKEEKGGKLEYDESSQDLGFKVLKLDKSNFKIWEAEDVKDPESIRKQLELHVDHIAPESSQEDILYELLLKSGFELTTKIEKIELAGKTVFSIAEGMLLICLEEELTKELIWAMADRKPSRVICLDKGFRNNDQLKTNAVQIMKSKGVEDFLTV